MRAWRFALDTEKFPNALLDLSSVYILDTSVERPKKRKRANFSQEKLVPLLIPIR